MTERTYGEKEIQALLKRAAQLQARRDDDAMPGLTLGELEQIAAEAGIDPTFLRAAAREAETGVGLHDVAGQTDVHVYAERTVSGTLTEAAWEAIVLRLRKQFSSDTVSSFGMGPQYGPGVIETLGATREWRHTSSLGVTTTVTIRSAEGVQHVRMQRRMGMASPRMEGIGYGALLAFVLSAIVAALASLPQAFFLPVLLLLFLVCFPAVEVLDRRWRARKLEELEAVADDVEAIIRTEAPADMAAVAAEAEGETLPEARPRLDLDGLQESEAEAASAPGTRTRA